MPGYSVIADTAETLQALVNAALMVLDPLNPPRAVIEDFANPISTNPPSVVVYLYEIMQDAITRNRHPVRAEVIGQAAVDLNRPPLPLMLRYLITPFAGDRMTEQRMLARTMQAMHDRPLRSGAELVGDPAPLGLAGSNITLKITLSMLTLEEKTRIWLAIQRPYRLSVVYEVRLIEVDSEIVTRGGTVLSRQLRESVPA